MHATYVWWCTKVMTCAEVTLEFAHARAINMFVTDIMIFKAH